MPFQAPKPLHPPPPELVGSDVLVVDDERAWRTILQTDLGMLGYRVWVARDAGEALAIARRRPPEVAIIDLMLPEPTDGWALMRKLRLQGTPTPVIFYTADSTIADLPRDPSVVRFVSKSQDRADLYALLPPTIRCWRRRRASPEANHAHLRPPAAR